MIVLTNLFYLILFYELTVGTDVLTGSEIRQQNAQKTVKRKEKNTKRKKDSGSAREGEGEGDNDREQSEGERGSGRESGGEGAVVGVKGAKQRASAKVR